MIKNILLGTCCIFLLGACAPKECRIAKNILVMPTDFSITNSEGIEFGRAFQIRLTDELAEKYKELRFTEGFNGNNSDLIIRLVMVEYSNPVFNDSLVSSGTGNVEMSVRIFDADGNFLRETYIMRDLKKAKKADVLDSITEEALKFIDKKCL